MQRGRIVFFNVFISVVLDDTILVVRDKDTQIHSLNLNAYR